MGSRIAMLLYDLHGDGGPTHDGDRGQRGDGEFDFDECDKSADARVGDGRGCGGGCCCSGGKTQGSSLDGMKREHGTEGVDGKNNAAFAEDVAEFFDAAREAFSYRVFGDAEL